MEWAKIRAQSELSYMSREPPIKTHYKNADYPSSFFSVSHYLTAPWLIAFLYRSDAVSVK